MAHSAASYNVEGTQMTEVVIASAARIPVDAFSSGLSSLAAHDLDEVAIKGVLEWAG